MTAAVIAILLLQVVNLGLLIWLTVAESPTADAVSSDAALSAKVKRAPKPKKA